ncbi:MAG: glutamate--tRNA ligase [Pseudomonadota bacterium]
MTAATPAPVVTRFAPSPTGFLHIGGARTALFNWLVARQSDGKMLLRIEDTDRARSTQEAVDAILDGLSWMGLQWDGDPISQFERIARHREVAETLLEQGAAYRCYATPQELEAMREAAKAAGKQPRYDGRWRDRDPADAPHGVEPVVRIKSPQVGETFIADEVQGTVKFPNEDLDDFVILRSDGTPTYMLAVVVDDHDMAVTHVIRGDDHLTNAARQKVIYDAMGWAEPHWAHIPLIHGPDGAKLSKRHGALGAEAYRAMGFLPQALRNYLVRLGWSHGDDEIMTMEQMIDWFRIEDVNKGAARFDIAKLEALNGHYIREGSADDVLEATLSLLDEMPGGDAIKAELSDEKVAQFKAALPPLKERSKTLVQLIQSAGFIFASTPLPMDEKASGLLDDGARANLTILHARLAELTAWDHDGIASVIKEFAEEKGLKMGKIAQPVRAALTGQGSSPGAFDVLLALGRNEALNRIADQMR